MAIPQRLPDASVDDEEEAEEVEIAEAAGVTSSTSSCPSSPSSSSSSEQQCVKLQISEVLDCPTCCEPLKEPIYQCSNGHVACSSCCISLRNRCAYCRSPIGYIRCRAMEKVIEASTVPCRYSLHGCNETTSYGNQSSHEKLCAFAPCFCPSPNCRYRGSYADLKRHARASHSDLIPFVLDRPQIFGLGLGLGKKRMAVLQEVEEGDLVVVQAFEGLYGLSVTVSCVAPMAPQVRDLSCSLARVNGCSSTVGGRLGLMVRKIQRVREEEQPPGGFMLIPYDNSSGDHLMLQICIGTESNFEL